MSASFYALFRRSRDSGAGPCADQDKTTMEEKGRFAGGMIGLGLKLDPQFRRHFLKSICGLNGLAEAHGWEILVEPEYWGDLVLRHAASRTQFVIEIKIDCELKKHQDPSKREFYSEARDGCSGYGSEIERWAKR